MQTEYDIVIAGGGMVGASLACSLAATDLRIALIEAVPLTTDKQPSYDERGLALSLSSQRIFQAMGVWPQLLANACPIKAVHVSDRGHIGKIRMDAASMGFEALGYVVIARELGAVLITQLKQINNVDIVCPAQVTQVQQTSGSIDLCLSAEQSTQNVVCKLLVVADGTRSGLRDQLGINTEVTDYRQTAIVSNVTAQLPHNGTAYERFTECGPLALLPLDQNRCVVVLTVPGDESEHYMQMEENSFLEEIQGRFGRRLGRLARLGTRRSYPIMQVQATQQVVGRAVLLGNSAHTIHPNGAQGFNLCLRDVAGLAEQLRKEAGRDPGACTTLDAYLLSRMADQKRTARLSHGLTTWFYNSQGAKAMLRNTAMTLIDLIPPAKAGLMRRGMGISGRQPALVRGPTI